MDRLHYMPHQVRRRQLLEDGKEAFEYLESGASIAWISEKLNISRATVYRAMRAVRAEEAKQQPSNRRATDMADSQESAIDPLLL